MAWIDSISNSQAVKVSASKRSELAQTLTVYGEGKNWYYRLFRDEVETETEYRGLTEAAALAAVNDSGLNYDNRTSRDWSPVAGATFAGAWIEGTVSRASASRANEAGGWTVKVSVLSVSTRVAVISD